MRWEEWFKIQEILIELKYQTKRLMLTIQKDKR
jgi:hypothetical protein